MTIVRLDELKWEFFPSGSERLPRSKNKNLTLYVPGVSTRSAYEDLDGCQCMADFEALKHSGRVT